MQDLLAKYHVGVQPGQIASSIDFGRARELTLAGVFAFVDDKLIEKREQGDAVYSAQLLIKAIRSEPTFTAGFPNRIVAALISSEQARASEQAHVHKPHSARKSLAATCLHARETYESAPNTASSRQSSTC